MPLAPRSSVLAHRVISSKAANPAREQQNPQSLRFAGADLEEHREFTAERPQLALRTHGCRQELARNREGAQCAQDESIVKSGQLPNGS